MLIPQENLHRTYAKLFERGVKKNWEQKFTFPWLAEDAAEKATHKALMKRAQLLYRHKVRLYSLHPEPEYAEIPPFYEPKPEQPAVRIRIRFIQKDDASVNNIHPRQKYIRVSTFSNPYIFSHVRSAIWRCGWGFLRNRKIEALGVNWSRKSPGNIYLSTKNKGNSFLQIAAHEFGHVLGIGDAYGAPYRFFYRAPGTEMYMMCFNRQVQSQEVEMVLRAHTENKMQFFPKKFILRNFLHGWRDYVKSIAKLP